MNASDNPVYQPLHERSSSLFHYIRKKLQLIKPKLNTESFACLPKFCTKYCANAQLYGNVSPWESFEIFMQRIKHNAHRYND